ncbi:DNA polymerase III subunit delta [Myxococcota bacterium]|nr:DNA polymerase III subunit delta [Myxococcota bacterium]MBU1537574.1 DNA polymerase III subunit delta [Myxococcota bacterium]
MSTDIIAKPITIENYSPIYGLFGKELFMRDRALKNIRSPFLQSEMGDLNHERFDAKEDSVATIVNAANSLPMFAKGRLIEVRNAELLNADELAPLLSYLASPNETTCLVLLGDQVDKKKKLFKVLEKLNALHVFNPGNKSATMAIIRRECDANGYTCESDVPSVIVEFLGDQDLGIALGKLFLYLPEGTKVTTKHVLSIVGSEGTAALFGFIDLFFDQSLEQALQQIKRLFDAGESAIALVSMLARQLRFIVYAKASEGKPDPSVPPFLRQKIGSLARRYSYGQLYDCHSLLYASDIKLKSSRLDPRLVMENMLYSWCFPTK